MRKNCLFLEFFFINLGVYFVVNDGTELHEKFTKIAVTFLFFKISYMKFGSLMYFYMLNPFLMLVLHYLSCFICSLMKNEEKNERKKLWLKNLYFN